MRTYYDDNLKDYVFDSEKPVFRVTEVTAKPDYTLELLFSNGERRVYDARRLLDFPIFTPLRDVPFFLGAYCDGCAVAWSDEIDIAPESLYENSVPV